MPNMHVWPLSTEEQRDCCRLSTLDAFEELRAFAPEREWRLILVAGTLEDVDRHRPHLLGETTAPPSLS